MPAAIPIITAAAGAYSAIDGADKARKAANAAQDQAKAAAAGTGGGAVNIAQLDQQAREIARRNAADSAALEAQYNPGAQELRSVSLQSLLAALDPNSAVAKELSSYVASGGPSIGGGPVIGATPTLPDIAARPETSPELKALLGQVAAQAGQPLTNTGFDSALTRDAVAQARADLALGGELPQDVRNLVARRALARSGQVTGGLQLGRDLTARDLGLTTLDLRNQRLAQAAALGSQEAGLEQANAAMRAQAEQFGRQNLLQSQQALAGYDAQQAQNYATDAQIAQARAALDSSNFFNRAGLESQNYNTAANRDSQNYFNQANLLQNIANGDFSRVMSAAQLGQNIAAPMAGLDPGSVVNLAVGNSNLAANSAQQAAALQAASGNQKSALGGQLLGTGLGFVQNYMNTPRPTVSAAPTYDYGYGYKVY